MADKGTSKKVTRVGGDSSSSGTRSFTPTAEAKGSATKFRIIALVLWLIAIGLEVFAIYLLKKPPIVMWQIITLIVADLVFAVAGILLWKKANRFDPASEKEPVRFFIQNQLGVIIAFIAFLPLVILIFTNKDLQGKQKGILGGIAIAALLIAGITGIDFNPPSQEQYAEQTAQVEKLTGKNFVYWTKSGKSYHLYSNCSYINTRRTDEIFEGTVADARKLKNITDLCNRCENQAAKEKGLDVTKIIDTVKDKALDVKNTSAK
ncbi:MAG TPA: hypothetical protein PK514_11855 [Spirochaetota bacterium]|nr:hypothetical protein [Spirochaetota bacterium]